VTRRRAEAKAAIYAFYCDGALTYIGSTQDLQARLQTHGLLFVALEGRLTVKARYCCASERMALERRLIFRLSPAWNSNLPGPTVPRTRRLVLVPDRDIETGNPILCPEAGTPLDTEDNAARSDTEDLDNLFVYAQERL
jgi:hypothetical protein